MSVCKSAPAPSKALLLLESRALPEFSAFCLMRPWLSLAPRGDGHPVLVLPGLLADDASTRPLRDFLKSQGYRVHGWKQGRNCGLRQNVESDMVAREVGADERAVLWPRLVDMYADFTDYQQRTDRTIPVIRLSPR